MTAIRIRKLLQAAIFGVAVMAMLPIEALAVSYIYGNVLDQSGQPINNAKVDSGTGVVSYSLNDGWYLLAVPWGNYTVTASAAGYQTTQEDVFVPIDINGNPVAVPQSFNLSPALLKLEAVYPTLGKLGEDLDVTLTGTAFELDTRVSMSPDVGNKKAIIGALGTSDARDIQISGNIAYIADGYSGLRLLDISDPASPVEINLIDPGEVTSVALSGSIAYIAGGGYFRAIDVSDPSNLNPIGSVPIPGPGWQLAVVGDTAFVADGTEGLQIIDISSPAHPLIVGNYQYSSAFARDVVVSGDLAYLAYEWDGLHIVDISNPAVPVLVGVLRGLGGYAHGVALSGSTVYLANSYEGLRVIDVSDPARPTQVGVVNTPGWSTDVKLEGRYAYVAEGTGGIQVIDVSNSAAPFMVGSINTPGYANRLSLIGTTAFVADGRGGLQVIDASDPSTFYIGFAQISTYTQDVAISGNYAYVIESGALYPGVEVVDISDPYNPAVIKRFDRGKGYGIEIVGNYAFIAGREEYAQSQDGLVVVDISTPSAPFDAGYVDTSGSAMEVSVSGAIAGLADSIDLKIIDISDPIHPVEISSVDPEPAATSSVYGVDIAGSTICITGNADTGLRVVDVSDPYHPTISNKVDIGSSEAVAIWGDYAIVGGTDQLYIVDINPTHTTPPTYLTVVGETDTLSSVRDITLVDATAYLAVGEEGIQVVDISVPTSPATIGNVGAFSEARGVAILGNAAYIADSLKTMAIMPLTVEISQIDVISDTEIALTLPAPSVPGSYTIRVFDESQSHELYGAVTFTSNFGTLNSKAILVAGGGPDAPGGIWEETKIAANKAYDVLIQQGYDHDSIYYLSLETDNPYVDNAALDVFLYDAINNWATDASELLIYFVDHGETNQFILYASGTYTQKLSAEELDGWLDDLQTGGMDGPITIVYDACQSGSFIAKLRPPLGKENDRIIITSASDEPAYFLEQGVESFSFQFWDKILWNEGNLGTAFSNARELMKGYQSALIDANGNGISNEDEDLSLASNSTIRRGSPTYVTVKPEIDGLSVDQSVLSGSTSATITATGVTDADSVWAQIIPPDINPATSAVPITELPSVELTDPDSDGVYTGSYTGFDTEGTYTIIVKAVSSQEVYSYVAGAKTLQNFYSLPLYTSVTQTIGIANIEADDYETDDTPGQARVVFINDQNPQAHNFHMPLDEDWVQFFGTAGKTYKIKTSNLSVFTDTIVEVYNSDGTPRPEGPQNIAGAGADEFIDWTCPQNGLYYVRITSANTAFGENIRYDLSVYLPVGGVGTVVGQITDSSNIGIDGVKVSSNIAGETDTIGGGWYVLDLVSGTHILTASHPNYAPQQLTVTVQDGNYLTGNAFVMPLADTDPPTATISYSTTSPTNQNVIATLIPSEAVTITNNGGLSAKTFTANGSFTFDFEDAAGNTGSATATVNNIDKTAPTYTIAYSPDTLTNLDVTATITLSDANTVTVSGGPTHVFNANGTHTFSFTDAAGNSGTALASVNWIDKVPPTGTVTYSTTSVTNENVTATLNVGDAVTVTSAGGASHVFTANGTHNFTFADAAGNTGSVTAMVNWIDKAPPTAVITYSTSDPTNQDVTATITVSGGAVTSGSSTHAFTTNGTYLFTFGDTAGNTGSALAAVDWIDRTPPSASISYNATSLTNQDVTATLSLNDANNVTVTNIGGSTHTFDSNGTFTFTFEDAAGNTGSAAAAVDWIDKTPPSASIDYSTTTLTNQNVVATLQSNEAIVVTNNNGLASRTFTENGSFAFTFEDAAGNAGTATATVANIDKAAPTYNIAYAPATLTNQNVTATITLSDGTVTGAGGNTHTFSENGTFVFAFTDAAGNTGTAAATVNWIDTTPPDAVITYSTTSLINQNVTASIALTEGTVTSAGGSTHTFTENGAFTFTFEDAAGSAGSAVASVNWIDKAPPSATITYNTTDPTNQNVLAVLHASEAVTVTNNNGASTRFFTENGSFTFTFEDAAENTGSATASVNNIDKTAPTYALSYSPASLTNQDVTATITLNDGTVVSAGGNTHTFSDNGTFTFVYSDDAGNTGTAVTMVTWIDKVPPNATLTYSATAPTTHDVVVTLIPDEAVLVTNNNGATQHTFTENGTFTFEYEDAAGNAAATTATVDNIYLSAPVAVLGDAPSGIVTHNSFAITVGGEDVDQYRYRTDSGIYSPAAAVGDPIVLDHLSEGAHTLEIIGRNAADTWQAESGATSVSWTVVCRGNVNGDDHVDLTDGIIVLKFLSGDSAAGMIRPDYAASGADISGDNKVGSEEAIYILQKEGDLR